MIIIIIWRNFVGNAGPNCWKMVIKSIRKLTTIRNNGTIQFQFFHRCIVGAMGSKFVNGLPCFSRITFRLTKSIRIMMGFWGLLTCEGGGKKESLQSLDLWRLASLILRSVLSMKFVSLIIYMGRGTKGDVTQGDLQWWFLVKHSVATLLQHCFE